MSEHVWRFLLSELAIARIACVKCGKTAEVPINQIEEGLNDGKCFFCDERLLSDKPLKDRVDALTRLSSAIEELNGLSKKMQIEFAITAKP